MRGTADHCPRTNSDKQRHSELELSHSFGGPLVREANMSVAARNERGAATTPKVCLRSAERAQSLVRVQVKNTWAEIRFPEPDECGSADLSTQTNMTPLPNPSLEMAHDAAEPPVCPACPAAAAAWARAATLASFFALSLSHCGVSEVRSEEQRNGKCVEQRRFLFSHSACRLPGR